MRSDKPIPGNPWPHDMILTIEDRPSSLRELLWLREAHVLHPAGDDLPPLLVETPAPAVRRVDEGVRAEWEEAWARVWREIAAHAGRESDPSLFDRIGASAADSPERESLIREAVGPSWDEQFDRDAFADDSYQDWQQKGRDDLDAAQREPLERHPERRDLDALIPAWRAGLTKIVTIPCRGEHTQRLGPNALLVTDGTRADSDRYRQALSSFR